MAVCRAAAACKNQTPLGPLTVDRSMQKKALPAGRGAGW